MVGSQRTGSRHRPLRVPGGRGGRVLVGIWGKAAFELEATPSQLALVMAALGLASLIGASVAGVLVDRFDPRRVVMVGEVLFVPAALALIFTDTIPTLAIATFVLGLVGTPVFTAISSFGPFLTDDENRLAKINSWIEGASWTAFVVGPAIGALLAGSIGIDAIFVLDTLTSLVAAVILIPIKVRRLHEDGAHGGGLTELHEGFRFAYRSPRLRFYILLGTAVWLLFGTFSSLSPSSTATCWASKSRPWVGSTRSSGSVWWLDPDCGQTPRAL